MELRHIRYFLAVADTGSFTKAAEELLIAQPPLSRQIKDLEEELGAELFIRRPRGAVLTEAGKRFLPYARRMEKLARQSADEIRAMEEGLSGTLYLATVEGLAPHLIAGWMAEFHRLYPQTDFNLFNGSTDDAIDRIQKGLCDMAVITAPYDSEGLEGLPVGEEPWVAMIPAGHALAAEAGEDIPLEKLADCDLIIPSRHSRRREILEWFAPIGKEPRFIGRISHLVNACELTRAGLGIAIFPESASRYAQDGVVIRRIVQPEVSASYLLVRSAARVSSRVAEEFWTFVGESGGR